jgi:hypothetical protein
MSEGIAGKAEAYRWETLLEQARAALSSLRADELDQLALRAESMAVRTRASGPELQPDQQLYRADAANLAEAHRMLGDLLLATSKNLEVLRRLRRRRSHACDPREVNSRWVL